MSYRSRNDQTSRNSVKVYSWLDGCPSNPKGFEPVAETEAAAKTEAVADSEADEPHEETSETGSVPGDPHPPGQEEDGSQGEVASLSSTVQEEDGSQGPVASLLSALEAKSSDLSKAVGSAYFPSDKRTKLASRLKAFDVSLASRWKDWSALRNGSATTNEKASLLRRLHSTECQELDLVCRMVWSQAKSASEQALRKLKRMSSLLDQVESTTMDEESEELHKGLRHQVIQTSMTVRQIQRAATLAEDQRAATQAEDQRAATQAETICERESGSPQPLWSCGWNWSLDWWSLGGGGQQVGELEDKVKNVCASLGIVTVIAGSAVSRTATVSSSTSAVD